MIIYVVKENIDGEDFLNIFANKQKAYTYALELVFESLRNLHNDPDAPVALKRIKKFIAQKEWKKALEEYNWENRFDTTVTVVSYGVIE